MADGNASPTLMHQLQSFLVEVIRLVHANLPAENEVLAAGRTVLRANSEHGPFGVRVRMGKHDDDMWPHVEAVLELPPGANADPDAPAEVVVEVHPDTDVAGHAEVILLHLGQAGLVEAAAPAIGR